MSVLHGKWNKPNNSSNSSDRQPFSTGRRRRGVGVVLVTARFVRVVKIRGHGELFWFNSSRAVFTDITPCTKAVLGRTCVCVTGNTGRTITVLRVGNLVEITNRAKRLCPVGGHECGATISIDTARTTAGWLKQVGVASGWFRIDIRGCRIALHTSTTTKFGTPRIEVCAMSRGGSSRDNEERFEHCESGLVRGVWEKVVIEKVGCHLISRSRWWYANKILVFCW